MIRKLLLCCIVLLSIMLISCDKGKSYKVKMAQLKNTSHERKLDSDGYPVDPVAPYEAKLYTDMIMGIN